MVLERNSELDFPSKNLRRDQSERLEQSSRSDIDTNGGERWVPLDLFSLVGAGIYKLSLTCHRTVLVELAEARLKSEEWAERFEKNGKKEKVLRKVSNNSAMKVLLEQSLSDTCCARNMTV